MHRSVSTARKLLSSAEDLGKLPSRRLLEVEKPSLEKIASIAQNKGLRKYMEDKVELNRQQQELLMTRRNQRLQRQESSEVAIIVFSTSENQSSPSCCIIHDDKLALSWICIHCFEKRISLCVN